MPVCCAYAQEGTTLLQPEEAVRLALENNPSQAIVEENALLARKNYELAKGAFLPVLSADASKTWSRQNSELTFNSGEQVSRDNAASSVLNAGLDAEWMVFDGLGMFHAYDRLRLLLEASRYDVEQAKNALAAQVLATYYQVVVQRERVEILKETLPVSVERRRLARDRYELGKSSKMELLAAQVDFNTDSAALLTQQQLLEQLQHTFNQLLGRNPQEDLSLADTLTQGEIALAALPEPAMLNQNPGLQAAQIQQQAAKRWLAVQKAQRWPTLSAIAGYNYVNSEAEVGVLQLNRTTGLTYGLTARWSLFNRFMVRQQIQQAAIQEKVAVHNLNELNLELQTAYADALTAYRLQQVQAELAQESLEVARQNASLALDRYRLGVSTFLELRVAQQNALQAGLRVLDALYAIKLTEINLKRLTGQLPLNM